MLNAKQVDMVAHAIGLQSNNRRPYRNGYCTGDNKCPDWDDLVTKGLAVHKDMGREMGRHYYYLNEKGLEFVIKNPKTFDMDRRIVKVATLSRMCND